MQTEGRKLIFIMNFSVLDFFKFASRMPQIAQILVSTFKNVPGEHAPGPPPPPPPPRYFLCCFFSNSRLLMLHNTVESKLCGRVSRPKCFFDPLILQLAFAGVPDQKSVSLLHIMHEMHHSGWEPSKYCVVLHCLIHMRNLWTCYVFCFFFFLYDFH